MFWKRFNYLCAKKGISANAAAKELSIASGTVSEWKKGRVPLNSTLKKIADYFDVSVDFLLGEEKMFYETLLSLCKENNITPTGLALKIGCSNATAAKWKKGSIPNGTTLQKIANYFNVSVDFLLGKSTGESQDQADNIPSNPYGLNLNPDQTEKLKEILERFTKLPEDKQDDYLDMFEKMLKMNDTND